MNDRPHLIPCSDDEVDVVGTRPFSPLSIHKFLRELDGRCGRCGLNTHSIYIDPLSQGRMAKPFTIPFEVYQGRCLLYNPLPIYALDKVSSTMHYSSEEMNYNSTSKQSSSWHDSAANKDLKTSKRFPNFPGWSESCEVADILYSMQVKPESECVQEKACEALWVQSYDDETSVMLGRLGGIHILLDVMSHFPGNAFLQRCCCEAIQNMAYRNAHNRKLIVNYGGAALVVKAMMLHLYSIGIQRSGCRALANLAESEELLQDILSAGGGQAITHSLRHLDLKHFSVEEYQYLRKLSESAIRRT